MAVPKVVIVGRPNVGKSSLLNWQAGKLVSVVDSMAGVTRDRVTYLMQADDRYFELIDTGGMGFDDPDDLTADVERQIDLAIEEAGPDSVRRRRQHRPDATRRARRQPAAEGERPQDPRRQQV